MPIGKILQQWDRTRGRGQLPIQQPLQPGMIAHLAGMLGREPRDGRAIGPAIFVRPLPPVGAELLGQYAKCGEALQRGPLLAAKGGELVPHPCPSPSGTCRSAFAPDRPQGLLLDVEDPVPVQARQGIQPAGLGGQLGELRPQPLAPRDIFDAKIERIAKSPRGGIVGAGPLGHDGGGRTERIDLHHAGPQSGRPLGQPPQVGQVADAPALPRPRAVKLHGPAPARLAGFDAPPRRDDDPRLPIAGRGIEVVIAQRQIGGQHVADGPPRAVFQDELSWRRPGSGRAGTDHADRLAPRGDAIGLGAAHGIQDRRRGIGGNLLPAVIGSGVEGGIQGVMIRHARQVPGVAGTIEFIRLYPEGEAIQIWSTAIYRRFLSPLYSAVLSHAAMRP